MLYGVAAAADDPVAASAGTVRVEQSTFSGGNRWQPELLHRGTLHPGTLARRMKCWRVVY